MFDAIILAGGGKNEPLTDEEQVFNKAFIEIQGRPMIAYIITALAGTPDIGRTFVIGPDKELGSLLKEGYDFTPLSEKSSMLENAAAALAEANRNEPCLVLTGDIPLITRESIEDFLKLCAPFEADFYYPILSRENCLKRFPQMKRTYVRLRDGYFTGGNIALIRPDWFIRSFPQLELFVTYRKKPLKLLRILPTGLILKFILNTLSVTDLERYLSQMMQAQARAVPCDFVEIGTDVDKISDLEIVRKALK